MKKRVFSFFLCVVILFNSLLSGICIEVFAISDEFDTIPKVAIGKNHTIALRSDGTVWCWGDSENAPVQVEGLENIIDIDADDSQNTSIALKSDGTVWVWGYIHNIVDSNEYYVNTPVKVEGIDSVIDISLGIQNVVALKSDGTVWCWGGNDEGQLGNGDYKIWENKIPTKVEGMEDVVDVTASYYRVAALKSDGTVWIWGGGSYTGQIGGGVDSSYVPIKVNGINDIKYIETGGYFGSVYMLDEQGMVWELDSPYFTTNDDGERTLREQPKQIIGLSDIECITVGGPHILAVDSIGSIWAYGEDGDVWLGYDVGEPKKIEKLQEAILVEGSLAIMKDGSIWELGRNTALRKFSDFSLYLIALEEINLDGPKPVSDSDIIAVELETTIELDIMYEPADAFVDLDNVQWSTSDSSIATVENGVVRGIKEGWVVISASIDGKLAECMVLVIPDRTGTCYDCGGDGKITERCERCSENGKTTCSKCSGKGTVFSAYECAKCNGLGYFIEYPQCNLCHGTGISFSLTLQQDVICMFCEGTGKFKYTKDCGYCEDGVLTQTMKCNGCGGNGIVTCGVCRGSKKYSASCWECDGEGHREHSVYSILYDANGGTNSPNTQAKIEDRKLQIDNIIPLREGYVFCGWAYESSAVSPDYMPGDYITDNKSIKLYAVWEEEKTLSSISVAQKPSKVTYIEGEKFDPTGLVVTAHYSNNTTETITNYEITGYNSTPGDKKIKITYEDKTVEFVVTVKSKIPQAITTNVYQISDNEISRITIGTTAKKLLGSINENQYVKIYKNQTEVKNDEIIGTGMVLKIMDGNTVVKSYKIIVTGDVNGDGNVSVTDMLAIKAHILGKNKLSDGYATAADTSGDSTISITDFIQLKAKVLGKGDITAR